MSRRIALVEHQRPRILTIDFSDKEAEKIRSLGFNVRSGFSGLYNKGEFSIPWSVQDVEILFATVSPSSFAEVRQRSPHQTSIERQPDFQAIIRELWFKGGWTVLFIAPGCSPNDLAALGFSYVGVVSLNRHFYAISDTTELKRTLGQKAMHLSAPFIPQFTSESVIFSKKPETTILDRYIHNAKMSVLAVGRDVQLAWATRTSIDYLITDESSTPNILALKITWGNLGNILLLPHFGKSNVDVAIGLLQGVIANESPGLFDSPEHPWLKDYLPHSVVELDAKKQSIVDTALAELAALDEERQLELTKFNWLLGLLTSTGDEFRDHAAEALRFLGFGVDVIDDIVPPGQKLKEDLHIRDDAAHYFVLGETKATKRGASETFITDIQNHQGRYSRENTVPVPDAMLIVNHSFGFDPNLRAGRFYTDGDLINRCREQGITAIDSVALFQMCQSVLRGEVNAEMLRRHIESGHQVIATFNSSELIKLETDVE